MLNTKNTIFILLLISVLGTVNANPFRSSQNKNVPIVRSSGGATLPVLIQLQMDFREKIASLMLEIKNSENNKGMVLLFFIGFLYGIVHAAGPGHRKTVLFSIFISNKSKWWEPGFAGVISAFLHGLSGIVLILIFKQFSTILLSSRVDLVSKYMETCSFILLLLLALILLLLKIYSILSKKNKLIPKKEKRNYYYTIMLTSLFPCPGAILILILSLSLGVLNIGIMTVVFLSLGMGLTISFTAYLGRSGRIGFFKVIKAKESKVEVVMNVLELSGYVFLMLLSIWMLLPVFYN